MTYGDVTLYTSDLELLEPPAWFSDKLLFFYYEWLSRTSVRNPAVLFVVPEMIQLLSWSQGTTTTTATTTRTTVRRHG